MKRINLVPKARLEGRARKTRIVRWATAVSTYGVLLSVAYLASVRYVRGDTRPLDTEARELDSKVASTNETVSTLSRELGQVQAKLRTAQAVGVQPDWSLLLALLSKHTSENIVLETCRLRRVQRDASRPAAAAPGAAGAANDAAMEAPLLLELEGFAKAQSNVAEYVLRLEQVDLFDKVKLVKTSRQEFMKNKTVGFSIECTFRSSRGGHTP